MTLSPANMPMRGPQNTLCAQYELNDLVSLPYNEPEAKQVVIWMAEARTKMFQRQVWDSGFNQGSEHTSKCPSNSKNTRQKTGGMETRRQ